MTVNKINNVLLDMHKCITNLQSQGEFFDIFSVLGIKDDERKHSAFLANLLDPQGSHGQKDLFLKCFIQSITFLNNKLLDIHVYDSFIQTELYLGLCDDRYSEGGSVDIAIINPKFTIFIENKIWAPDQLNQLYRYCTDKRNAIVLYLTPDGRDASELSTFNGKIKRDIDYHCISYENHIIRWLDFCISEVSDKYKINDTLTNYKNTIEVLTKGGNMGNDIIKEIIKSEDAIESAFFINKYMIEAKIELLNILAGQLEKESNNLLVFNFERQNWDYADGSEAYLHFKYKNSKDNITISLDFEWKSYFQLYVGVSDLVLNKSTINQKKAFSRCCNGFGKDMDYSNWHFISLVPGILGDWDSNVDNWKGIKNGKTSKQLVDIVKEIHTRIAPLL